MHLVDEVEDGVGDFQFAAGGRGDGMAGLEDVGGEAPTVHAQADGFGQVFQGLGIRFFDDTLHETLGIDFDDGEFGDSFGRDVAIGEHGLSFEGGQAVAFDLAEGRQGRGG